MSSVFVRYERRAFDDLCQQVCELDDKLLAVTVAEDGMLVGTCLRKGFPIPEKGKLATMLLQAGIVFSIARTSEDFHGRAKCVTFHYANIDEHLFPLAAECNRMMIVSTIPYTMDAELMRKIATIALVRNEQDRRENAGRAR